MCGMRSPVCCIAVSVVIGAILVAVPSAQAPMPAEQPVIVLEPHFRGESLATEQPVALAGADAYAAVVRGQALGAVQRLGLSSVNNRESEALTAIVGALQELAPRFARGLFNKAATEHTSRLAAIDRSYHVLATFVRVKVGANGSWDAMTGAITSTSSSIQVSAALVACDGPRVAWRNDIVVRGLPMPTDSKFTKAVAQLFSGINTTSGAQATAASAGRNLP
jgi:hypothetical protein